MENEPDPILEVVTHDGKFHADDALCFALLEEYVVGSEIRLVRTRDPAFTVPAENRFIFDVGGLHDPGRFIFDHHQADRTLREDGTPYSAFGLLWKHMGAEYLQDLDLDLPDDVHPRLWKEVDEGFVHEIDAYDNGTAADPPPAGHVSSLVEDLVPRGPRVTSQDMDREFKEASRTVGWLFKRHVYRLASAWRDVARFQDVADLSLVPGVAVLPEGLGWKKAVRELALDDLLYVVHPKEDDSIWYCAAVPVEPSSFSLRCPLPERWAGLRDGDLAAVCGVPDAVFCHGGRFLCAAGSRDGALELARLALRG